MTQQPSDPDKMIVAGVFEGFDAQELFAMWVVPDFLVRWWPNVAHVKSGLGGTYRFEWPDRGWVLEGTYTAWDPGRHLGFSWKWNLDPADSPLLHVDVLFDPRADGGTCITITQGPYTESEQDQAARQAHAEGWIHYCMRIAGLRYGDLAHGDASCSVPEAS